MSEPASQPTPTASAIRASQAIPFRPETSGPAGSIVEVLLLLTVLLGAFVAALLFARKKGWLERWGVIAAPTPTPANSLRVEQVLRLSPKSSLYRVRNGERAIVILESNGAAQVVETTMQVKDEL